MIVRDEEEVLSRCLESAAPLFDEVVIADTGSKDRTVEIAKQFTQAVYSFPWCDDFSAARNFALSKATGDYLVWLDADDQIPNESAILLPALKELLSSESPDLVMCPYDTSFDGEGNPVCSFYRERFIKAASHFTFQGRVHECIAPRGKVIRFPFRVRHLGSRKERGMRNLILYQKWKKEVALSPRDLFYYGRELFYHGLYTEAIAVLEEMLSSDGWYVNKIDACRTLGLCRLARGETQQALTAFFRSFCFGEPRAFVCCEIGKLFRAQKNLNEAAFWFESALRCRDHSEEGDFEDASLRGIVPALELVCIYYEKKDLEKALFYHKKSEEFSPNHPSVVYNRKFFGSIS